MSINVFQIILDNPSCIMQIMHHAIIATSQPLVPELKMSDECKHTIASDGGPGETPDLPFDTTPTQKKSKVVS
jgi:hypothetical protein